MFSYPRSSVYALTVEPIPYAVKIANNSTEFLLISKSVLADLTDTQLHVFISIADLPVILRNIGEKDRENI